MTIVNPLASSHLVAQAAASITRPEERQNDLRLEQIVRATVVEGGLDRAMLDLKQERFWIQTDRELQTGQQLELQVLTTHPKLSFKLLAVPLEARLSALFPLLAKPFDWNGLLQQLQQGANTHPETMKKVISQLSAFIRPAADLPAKDFTAISTALGRLQTAEPLFSGANGAELATTLDRLRSAFNRHGEPADLTQQLKVITEQIRRQPELTRALAALDQQKLAGLLKQIDQPQQALQTDQARQLLTELKTLWPANQTQLSQLLRSDGRAELAQQLKSMAQHIGLHPQLGPELSATEQKKLAGLLKQIEPAQTPLQPDQARMLATELKALLVANSAQLPQFVGPATQSLQLLLNPPAASLELSAAILGQLQDLVGQLELAAKAKPDWSPDLRQLVQQILTSVQPLIAEPEILAQGTNLGLLSQLFGLNLEAELLRGRTRDALSSLKLALLGERAELGPKGEEALHRLELFQICRVRLAEQNVNFVPLPLPFLEEGFLLVEEHGGQDQQPEKEAETVRLTLHLRLSSLGNLRVDMLSEPSGLLLRVACEDQQRVDFLQSLGDQLDERLQELNIRGVSFTTGVDSPARELLKRILPSAQGMLDARV